MKLILQLSASISTVEASTLGPILSTSSKPFELRDYQKVCIAQIFQAWQGGFRAPLLYAPTGAGKTAIASHIMSAATKKGHKVLFIVHREPLVEQTANALKVYGIDCGYIKAGYEQTDGSHQVIVASIQTLARREFPLDIGLVIVDEAHSTAWYQTYGRCIIRVCFWIKGHAMSALWV